MDIKRFRIKKHRNGTYLPTITKEQKSYQSQFNENFEWLPHIVGNSAIIGLGIYSSYSLYSEYGVSLQELLTDAIIYLSLGCIIAYLIQPKKSDD